MLYGAHRLSILLRQLNELYEQCDAHVETLIVNDQARADDDDDDDDDEDDDKPGSFGVVVRNASLMLPVGDGFRRADRGGEYIKIYD